jgi:peptide-methionine (S)-S-oxide reductase
MQSGDALATFGGGCFWCLEAVFLEVVGVRDSVSGYAGGHVVNPSYQAVCAGTTGHAEVVQLTFDSQQITYAELVTSFLTMHDPTTPNRQGHDVGTQYRSIILAHDDAQHAAARGVIAQFSESGVYSAPIVTEIAPFSGFYPAETYHQRYFANHARQPYCQVVIAPKVAKMRAMLRQNQFATAR